METEVINDDLEAEEIERDQYLVFTAQSQEFGFPATQVREITMVSAATEVPNTPSYIEGIVNLRGQLATVINFCKKFGVASKEHDEDTRMVIVEKPGFSIGIVVDSVEEVIRISDEKVHKLSDSTGVSVLKETITGVGMLDDRLIILLDVDQVLAQTELMEEGAISRAINETQAVMASEKADNNETDAEQPADTKMAPANKEGD